MKNSIKTAQLICKCAHAGQKDLAGEAYWKHPYEVAHLVSGKKAKIVAYLHDVLEDTDVGYDILGRYFTQDILDALRAITHDKSVPYMPDYMNVVKRNSLATQVKIADMEHNSKLNRLPHVTDKDIERVKKYSDCIKYLKQK
jgi:(p)ppGpp synthase/HD superfamily hydrolase